MPPAGGQYPYQGIPHQQPNSPYAPGYGDTSDHRGYAPVNDNGSTVHCGTDYDHRPHRFHSKMHHEHYCPGGPHHHD